MITLISDNLTSDNHSFTVISFVRVQIPLLKSKFHLLLDHSFDPHHDILGSC